MKKNFILFCVLLMCSFLFTGCVDIKINEEVTIKMDKTAEHSIKCLFSNNVYMFAGDILPNVRNSLQESGYYSVSDIQESNYFGVIGRESLSLKNSTPFGENRYFSIDDRSIDFFLFKKYDITANVNLDEMFKDQDMSIITLSEYSFTLNLPVKIRNSNAQKLFNEGKSATWYFHLNQSNDAHFECYIPNVTNIIITVVTLGTILLIWLIILLIKKNKKNGPIEELSLNCPHCGNRITEGQKFCRHCGKSQLEEHVENPDANTEEQNNEE